MWLATLVTCTALAGLLVTEWAGKLRYRWVFKPIASAGFVAVALAASAWSSAYGRAVLVALILAWCGDVMLIGTTRRAFAVGLLAFMGAHVAFSVAFVAGGLSLAWGVAALPVFAASSGAVARWLVPRVERRLRAPVVVYVCVLSFMAILGVAFYGARSRPLPLVAALAFYASDFSVALDRFGTPSIKNRAWGLPLYYTAELLFAWSTG